jgi:hypothetical protein
MPEIDHGAVEIPGIGDPEVPTRRKLGLGFSWKRENVALEVRDEDGHAKSSRGQFV